MMNINKYQQCLRSSLVLDSLCFTYWLNSSSSRAVMILFTITISRPMKMKATPTPSNWLQSAWQRNNNAWEKIIPSFMQLSIYDERIVSYERRILNWILIISSAAALFVPWWYCWGSCWTRSWWSPAVWTRCRGGRWSPWTRTCWGAASPPPPPPPGSRCWPRSVSWCRWWSCSWMNHVSHGDQRWLRSPSWSCSASSGASSPAPSSPPSHSGLLRSAAWFSLMFLKHNW